MTPTRSIIFIELINRSESGALGDAIAGAHFEVATDQRAIFVDRTHHCVAIQRRAPTVGEPQHHIATPRSGIDKTRRHAGFRQQ